MNCKNCERKVDGEFCGYCGQNSKVGRINAANFVSELSTSVFQINRGFFFTLKELSVRPGESINEYLNGRRKRHFKPIAYVLTLATLYFLITQSAEKNTWIDDLITGWAYGATGQEKEAEISGTTKWFAENYAYSTLLLLPVFSLASYLSFLKFDKNYLEHLVINSYITGHQAIIYSVFALVGIFSEHDSVEALSLLSAMVYNFWVYWQLFIKGNRVVNLLRTIMTYVLYLVFSFVFLVILAGIGEL